MLRCGNGPKLKRSEVAGPTPAEPGHLATRHLAERSLMARAADSRSGPWNTLV